MTELPAPLVPPDVNISGLNGFMLDVQRLFASELWALSTGDEFKAALALWGWAWQQNPPGSLPKDDKLLGVFSGVGAKWSKVRSMALRGFVECSDGRLYHRVLCEDVIKADLKRKAFRQRTANATEARRSRNEQRNDNRNDDRSDGRNEQRNDNRNDDRSDGRNEQRNVGKDDNVTSVQGQGQGQVSKKEANQQVSTNPAEVGWRALPKEKVADFKTEIIREFQKLGLQQTPDTGRAEIWLAQGYDPAICLAVIADGLPRKRDVKGLKYFDNAIAEAHQNRSAKPNGSADPSRKERGFYLGPDHPNVPERNMPGVYKMFVEKGYWPRESPKPGEPGCQMPDKYLPEHLWSTACSGVSVEQKKRPGLLTKVVIGGLPEDPP